MDRDNREGHKLFTLISTITEACNKATASELGESPLLELKSLKLATDHPLPDHSDDRVCEIDCLLHLAGVNSPYELARWMVWVEQRVEMLEGLSPQDRERALRLQLEFSTLEARLKALLDTPIKLKEAVHKAEDTVGCMNLELAQFDDRIKTIEHASRRADRLVTIKGLMILFLSFCLGTALLGVGIAVATHAIK